MRKARDIKNAAKDSDEELAKNLIVEILLDVRELLKKQNEMLKRRSNGRGNSKT